MRSKGRGWRSSAVIELALMIAAVAQAGTVDTVFTYQGLLNLDGTPASGQHDMQFRLYNSAGAQVGPTLTFDGQDTNPDPINLTDGLFTAPLNFGPVFDGTALWLEIDVRPAGSGPYTTLAPRQALTAAPFALFALSGPGGGDSLWQLDGSDIHYDQGNVGIGAPSAGAKLHVAGQVHSRGGTAQGFYVYNPNNEGASAHLGWLNNVARIRYGGNGAGADGGFAIQKVGDATILRLLDNGNLGLGDSDPQARLHLRTSDLALASTALEEDELIVEGQDPVIGLYGSSQGDWSAGIALKEVSGGDVVDNWGIVRRTTAAATSPSALRFTYGASDNYAANPALLAIENDGRVGIGTDAPEAFLDIQSDLEDPNKPVARFIRNALSNEDVLYAEIDANYVEAAAIRGVDTGIGIGVAAHARGSVAIPLVAENGAGGSNNLIAEFRRQLAPVARIDTDGDLSLAGNLDLEQLGGGHIRFADGSIQSTAGEILSAEITVNPPSLGSGSNAVITVTISGAQVGDVVVANPGMNLALSYAISFVRVSAADTVSIGLINPSSTTVDPAASTWRFRVIK